MARVLVCEDEENIRSLITHALAEAGHTVVEACDGAEALRAHRGHPVDILVTDIVMPVKDGLEVIHEFKQQSPRLPVIAYTGHPASKRLDYLGTAAYAGASKVFKKPFDMDEMLRAIEELLKNPGSQLPAD
jgi:DNA-binding NtrC family response regulator